MTEVKPATAELLRQFYGETLQPTVRAFVVMDSDEVISVVGFIRFRAGIMILFSDTKPGAQKTHPMTTVKVGRMLMKIADDNKWTLLSWPNGDIEAAERFLRFLGFEPGENGEWVRCGNG